MPNGTKIATCCYCGARAALVLDRRRHELACGSCGAPLHEMKSLPVSASPKPVEPARAPRGSRRPAPGSAAARRPMPPRKRKRRRKSGIRRVLEEVWDVLEDVFD